MCPNEFVSGENSFNNKKFERIVLKQAEQNA